jgi:hypothetical protein
MKDCEKFRNLMAEALLGDISAADEASLESHAAGCAGCAAEYRALRLTLELVDKREKPDPGEAFWDGYWDRLTARQEREKSTATKPSARRRMPLAAFGGAIPRWAWQAAAALVLVGAGVFIGRLAFSPSHPGEPIVTGATSAAVVPAEASDAAARARSYLDRSKLVILALVNYNPATEDAYALDLPLQKRVARELVNEAGWLKAGLKDPRERRLRELVSDLETILMQIANLGSGQDLEAVGFVKQAVAVRGVLLKINLSEMQTKRTSEKPTDTHRRPGIKKSSA